MDLPVSRTTSAVRGPWLRRLRLSLAAVAACLGAAPGPAAAAPLPRIAVSLPASASAVETARLLQASGAAGSFVILPPLSAQIGGRAEPPPSDAPPGDVPKGAYARLRLEIAGAAASGRDLEVLVERQVDGVVRQLALDRPEVAGLVVEARALPGAADDVAQFALATLIVKARAAKTGLQVAVELPPSFPQASTQRVLAYADSVVVDAAAPAGGTRQGAGTAAAGRPVMARVSAVEQDDARAGSAALLSTLVGRDAAGAATLWVELPGPAALRGRCATLQCLGRTLDAGFEMTAPERAPAAVLVDGQPPPGAVAFVGSRSADVAVLVRARAAPGPPRVATLVLPAGRTSQVTCFDPMEAKSLDVQAPAGQPPACRAEGEYVLVHATIPSGADRLFESVSVTGRASLSVEEVIARWQAAREAERRLLDHYSVPVFMSLHFDAASAAFSIDVALELTQFADRNGLQDWVQTGFRVNGVKLRRGQEFPLPQVEPDKVVTRPLELRVDEKYTYELLGTETVRDRPCYVVGIRSGQSSETLYSGKVWIDGVTFTEARVRLEQRDGRNNVASHVETQELEPVADAQGRSFTLVRSIFAEDSVNLAGRSVLIEKHYRYGAYAINTPDFAARLAEARKGDDPMFRDTDQGLRALRKKGDSSERVVEPPGGKRIWALLGGVLYTGAYRFPVPLAGASLVDFDFRKTGTQLSVFFAGPILVANLSRQVSKAFRWGLDLSVIALPNVFYEYSGSTELKGQQVLNFEQFAGGLANWQATSELVLSTQGHVYWDVFRATSDTDPAYRIPASGVSFDAYGEAKYNRKSFSAVATVEHNRRQGWRQFGFEEKAPAVYPNWTRYSIEVGQHVFVGKLTRGGVSAGYYGGTHLDRFSRYSPSFLGRPKLNGIPSGVDSFDEVTTLGAYYGFNVLDVAKLEGAYTHAWTRNRDEGNALRQFDGLNLSIGMAGPLGTFVQGSVSLALRGNLERYRTRWGTYLVFLKPLRTGSASSGVPGR